MYLIACITLHVISSRYQVGNSGGGTAAAAARSSGICGWCVGSAAVVWCRVVRGVCCWWCGVCDGRYPLDGLKAKKCLPPVVVISPCGVPYWYFFCCYVAVTP